MKSSLSSTSSNCRLNGTIPKALGQLVQLTRFDMSFNNISGSIPKEMFVRTFLNFYINDNPLLTGCLDFVNVSYCDASNTNVSTPSPRFQNIFCNITQNSTLNVTGECNVMNTNYSFAPSPASIASPPSPP